MIDSSSENTVFVYSFMCVECVWHTGQSLLLHFDFFACRFYLFIYLCHFVFAFRLFQIVIQLFCRCSLAHSALFFPPLYYYSGLSCTICILFLSALIVVVYELFSVAVGRFFFSFFLSIFLYLVIKAKLFSKKQEKNKNQHIHIIHNVFNLCKLVI